ERGGALQRLSGSGGSGARAGDDEAVGPFRSLSGRMLASAVGHDIAIRPMGYRRCVLAGEYSTYRGAGPACSASPGEWIWYCTASVHRLYLLPDYLHFTSESRDAPGHTRCAGERPRQRGRMSQLLCKNTSPDQIAANRTFARLPELVDAAEQACCTDLESLLPLLWPRLSVVRRADAFCTALWRGSV